MKPQLDTRQLPILVPRVASRRVPVGCGAVVMSGRREELKEGEEVLPFRLLILATSCRAEL